MKQNRSSSTLPLIVGIVLALGLLGGVNFMMQRQGPMIASHDDNDEHGGGETGASPSPAASAPASGQQLMDLGNSKSFGFPSAPVKIVIGWQMTPQVQAAPGKVYDAVSMVQQAVNGAGGKFYARVVNIDADASVPAGVSIGGKTRLPLDSDGGIDVQKLQYVLQGAMRNQ